MKAHKLGERDAPAYDVLFQPAAEREFLEPPAREQARFEKAIDGLETDPFTTRPGVDVTKLADLGGGATLHRLRVGKRRA